MEHSLFARLGRFAVRRRWFVIPAWVAILVVMGSFAKGLTGRLSSGGFEVPNSESLSVLHDLQSTFSAQFPSTALVVVTNHAVDVHDPAYQATVEGVASRLKSIHGVGAVYDLYNT